MKIDVVSNDMYWLLLYLFGLMVCDDSQQKYCI